MPQKWKMRLTWSWKYYLMMPVGLLESQLKALSRRQALESFVFYLGLCLRSLVQKMSKFSKLN
jgi:hypothetical protein